MGGENMKRKKRYYKKRKKKKTRLINESKLDCHHIFWQRKMWNKGYLRELRDFYYCRVIIPKNTLHYDIHQKILFIPIPRPLSARFAIEQLEMLDYYGAISDDDSFEKRLKILIELFKYVDEPTAQALKTQLDIVRRYNNPS